MFLHIGKDTMVALEQIIGIFDVRLEAESSVQSLLNRMQGEGRVETVEAGDTRSLVLTLDTVYRSPISSSTLKGRAAVLERAKRVEIR